MKASTPTVATPLRQAWPLLLRDQAGGLAAQSVDILFKDASLLRASARKTLPVYEDTGRSPSRARAQT